jgi:hypothetical protein
MAGDIGRPSVLSYTTIRVVKYMFERLEAVDHCNAYSDKYSSSLLDLNGHLLRSADTEGDKYDQKAHNQASFSAQRFNVYILLPC